MRVPHTLRSLTALAVVLMAGMSCDGQSPTAPAPVSPFTRIRNLQAQQLGLPPALCNAGFSYQVHDELTFEVAGQSAASLVGATLHHALEDGTETLIGPVTQCAETVSACSAAASVCVRESSDSGGTIRAFARVPWTPERRWNLFLRSHAKDSNRLSATIARPDNLPMGPNAAIAFIDARRSSSTGGSYTLIAYSPAVTGRRIYLTREAWSGGVRLSTLTFEFSETPPAGTVGFSGGITITSSTTELVGIMEERDFGGNLVASDRKTIVFK